jgi:hypothetical protein
MAYAYHERRNLACVILGTCRNGFNRMRGEEGIQNPSREETVTANGSSPASVRHVSCRATIL